MLLADIAMNWNLKSGKYAPKIAQVLIELK